MADVKIKAVLEAEDKASAKVEGLNMSLGKLTGAVGIGTLAADAFKKGISFLTNVVTSSIEAFSEAEATMGQVDAILRTTNTSLKDQSSIFANTGKAALAMAFDDEEAQLALAKLYQGTGDMKFAQESLTAAMDIARYTGKDLGESTQALIMAYMGNNKMLKQMQIETQEGASKLDILRLTQDKTKDSAVTFAETYAGKNEILSLSIENLKETFGEAIARGISPYLTSLTDNVTRSNDVITGTDKLAKSFYQVIGALQVVYNSFIAGGKGLAIFVVQTELFSAKMTNLFGRNKEDVADLERQLQALKESAGVSLNNLTDSWKKMMGEGFVPATQALSELSTVNKNYTNGVNESIKSNKEATDAIEDVTKAEEENKKKMEETAKTAEEAAAAIVKAMEEAKEKTNEYRIKIIELKADSITAFKEMQAEIKTRLIDETKRLNEEITKLNDEYLKNKEETVKDGSENIVEIIVDKENEAADLQAQIAKETNEEKKVELQEKLNIINAFLLKHNSDYIKYAEELKAYQEYDKLDEIEKIKFDTAEKLALLKQAHKEKLKEMEDEHKENIKRIKEQLEETRKLIAQNFKNMFEDLIKGDEMTLIKNLMKEALKFDIVIDTKSFLKEFGYTYLATMAEVAAAKKAGKDVVEISGKYYGKQMGGFVAGGTPYIVGEAGPELFVPSGAGQIVPNNKLGGSSSININFNNPVVRSENDLSQIIAEVKRVLNRSMVLESLRI